jgi:hypothetical protein
MWVLPLVLLLLLLLLLLHSSHRGLLMNASSHLMQLCLLQLAETRPVHTHTHTHTHTGRQTRMRQNAIPPFTYSLTSPLEGSPTSTRATHQLTGPHRCEHLLQHNGGHDGSRLRYDAVRGGSSVNRLIMGGGGR